MRRRPTAVVFATVLVVAVAPPSDAAESLRGIGATLFPALERAQQASRAGDPSAMQGRYEAARAIVEHFAVRRSPDCASAVAAQSAYARRRASPPPKRSIG